MSWIAPAMGRASTPLPARLRGLWRYWFEKQSFLLVDGPHCKIFLDPAKVPDYYKPDIASCAFECIAMTRAQFERLPKARRDWGAMEHLAAPSRPAR